MLQFFIPRRTQKRAAQSGGDWRRDQSSGINAEEALDFTHILWTRRKNGEFIVGDDDEYARVHVFAHDFAGMFQSERELVGFERAGDSVVFCDERFSGVLRSERR